MAEDLLTTAFVRLRTVLKGRAGRVLGSESAADDALQEAFYKLWQRNYPLQSVKDAEALLSRAVSNAAIDQVRRRKRNQEDTGREIPDEAASEEPESREEMLGRVRMLIDSELSPLQRRILRWRDMEGHSYEAIALKLGMQETAVRMQLSRARKAIREQYEKQRYDG